mgnify:FL=1
MRESNIESWAFVLAFVVINNGNVEVFSDLARSVNLSLEDITEIGERASQITAVHAVNKMAGALSKDADKN